MELNIIHDKKYQQFTATIGDEDAELAYAIPSEEVIDFTHTYVPESARGKGVAVKLIEEGLCYAEENGKKVVATCPVVKRFIDRNSNYQKLLQK